MTRNHSNGSVRKLASYLLLAGVCVSGFSGCKSASSITSWRPKFMGGSAATTAGTADASYDGPTVEGPNGTRIPMNKLTVNQPEGITPVDPGGSILDQAPPPGTYPPGYVPQIQKVPFADMGPVN